MDFIRKEPAVCMGLIQAFLGLVITFGVKLTPEQTGLIMTITGAIVSIAIRQVVTPVGTLKGSAPEFKP